MPAIELRVHGKKFNGIPLGKLHLFCLLQRALQWRWCMQVLTAVTCAGGLFLRPLSAFTFSGTCGTANFRMVVMKANGKWRDVIANGSTGQ